MRNISVRSNTLRERVLISDLFRILKVREINHKHDDGVEKIGRISETSKRVPKRSAEEAPYKSAISCCHCVHNEGETEGPSQLAECKIHEVLCLAVCPVIPIHAKSAI